MSILAHLNAHDKKREKQEDLLRTTKVLYEKQNENEGNCFLCVKTKNVMKNAGFKKLSDFPDFLIQQRIGKKDYYIPANTFFGDVRDRAHLFSLNAIVIDIDVHPFNSDKDDQAARHELKVLAGSLDDLISWSGLPWPTSVTDTGRGLQIWYSLKQASYKMTWMWEKVAKAYAEQYQKALSHFCLLARPSVDMGASTNPAGLFRMPGTWNTSAERWGSFAFLGGSRINLSNEYNRLIGEGLIEKPAVSNKKKPKSNHSSASKAENTTQTKEEQQKKSDRKYTAENYTPIACKRRDGIFKVAEARGYDVTRDLFLFVLYCVECTAGISEEQRMADVAALNAKFVNPMPQHEYETYLSTARRKNGYKMSNKKIIELLDLNEEECDLMGFGKQPAYYDREKAEKRRKEKQENEALIIRLAKKGKLNKEIAAEADVSESTVGRILKKNKVMSATERKRERAKRALKKGLSILEACKKSGLKETVVRAIAHKVEEEKRQLEEIIRKRKENKVRFWNAICVYADQWGEKKTAYFVLHAKQVEFNDFYDWLVWKHPDWNLMDLSITEREAPPQGAEKSLYSIYWWRKQHNCGWHSSFKRLDFLRETKELETEWPDLLRVKFIARYA